MMGRRRYRCSLTTHRHVCVETFRIKKKKRKKSIENVKQGDQTIFDEDAQTRRSCEIRSLSKGLFFRKKESKLDQWQPQLFTTMFLYFFRITLLSSRKYKTEMAESFVGAQQGFGTLPGLTRCTNVCTIAWLVAFIWAFKGKLHSPLQ